jgi:hypothetical protein
MTRMEYLDQIDGCIGRSLILSSDCVIEILIRNCIISFQTFSTKRPVTPFPPFSIKIKDPDNESD